MEMATPNARTVSSFADDVACSVRCPQRTFRCFQRLGRCAEDSPRFNTIRRTRSSITPLLQHSIPPRPNACAFGYSAPPTLQHSNTPLLHYSITPSFHPSIPSPLEVALVKTREAD